ncbi:DUF3955 domain-containing protein [Ancylomarina salipaludis]|uniref:DUF3955 domain-containing protein n=1 Tax=Ancylomarina salipaludis TaxID=2501299 RepID=A0A4Q1JQD9_9BACT|nr:DUF3955 domain-containing protein [Ancylomarina salipaludis]RXQ97652.1 DUF3955 domain-containing protein [Ancylomarina salipaludis]
MKIFWIGIIVFALGIALRIQANLSTYVDNEGVMHESFSTPLSFFFAILGIILLIISLFINLKNKKTTKGELSSQ